MIDSTIICALVIIITIIIICLLVYAMASNEEADNESESFDNFIYHREKMDSKGDPDAQRKIELYKDKFFDTLMYTVLEEDLPAMLTLTEDGGIGAEEVNSIKTNGIALVAELHDSSHNLIEKETVIGDQVESPFSDSARMVGRGGYLYIYKK